MNEQPTALWLADELEDACAPKFIVNEAAAELRRLYDRINTLEAALRQALEALELYQSKMSVQMFDDTAKALRERLAQPQMQPCAGRNCGSTNPNLHSAECFEDYEKSTGIAQPEQEPVCVGGPRNAYTALAVASGTKLLMSVLRLWLDMAEALRSRQQSEQGERNERMMPGVRIDQHRAG